MKIGKYYFVRWLDAFRLDGWNKIDSVKRAVTNNIPDTTIGKLIYESDNLAAFAASVTGTEEYGEIMVIPKCTILEWREVCTDKKEDLAEAEA